MLAKIFVKSNIEIFNNNSIDGIREFDLEMKKNDFKSLKGQITNGDIKKITINGQDFLKDDIVKIEGEEEIE